MYFTISPSANKELTPYIDSIEGTALIGQPSKITIKGSNFNPESEIICTAGILSNIQISPNAIYFDCLASSPGSYPVEVKNNSLSSNDWNNSYSSILVARNELNITNGWLDFRTANSANFGNITSHINQSLSTKTFTNSGYTLDATRGLILNNSTFTANSTANYIQFNSYPFPLSISKFEIICNFDTTFTTVAVNRARIGLGLPGSVNTLISGIEYTGGNLMFNSRFLSPYTGYASLYLGSLNSQLLNNNFYYLKFIFNFISGKIEVHKLNNNNDLESINKIEEIPINILGRTIHNEGIPLFNFYNSGSLSSVIAMKIS